MISHKQRNVQHIIIQFQIDACGKLRLVALAPEIEGIQEAMQYFLKHDVKLAFAHSDLKSEGTKQAIAQGITVATHLSNVMTGLHHRDLGALGTLLMSDRSYVRQALILILLPKTKLAKIASTVN